MRTVSRIGMLALVCSAIMFAQGCAVTSEVTESVGERVAQAKPKAGWQKVVPGGDTMCSDGSEFAFYTRQGDPKKLLFFLQGGGGCWNLQTCDPLGKPSYTVNLDGLHPSESDGVFNFSRADNPLRDHTVVFVPYCSADVHIGQATQHYKRSPAWIEKLNSKDNQVANIPAQFTIAHKGLANARAALRWTSDKVVAPESVLVTGSSAGSIPSPYYAVQLAAQYPQAQISQLGDGSGGYRRMNQKAAPQLAWGTVEALTKELAFASLTQENFNFEKLYTLAHAAAPGVRLHAYDTAEDDVQLQFLALSGLKIESLHTAITQNQADIRVEVPAFRSYIAPGELHTILRRPEFYRYEVAGRSVRDWVADVVAGKAVSDVDAVGR